MTAPDLHEVSQMNEVWRPVPHTDNRYHASNLGRIVGPRGSVLKQYAAPNGYLVVTVVNAPSTLVHRLIAFAFPSGEGTIVRHLDGNRHNNRAENLRWGTPKENTADTIEQGNHSKIRNTHCPSGHSFAEYSYRNYLGHRRCLICQTEQAASYRARRRAKRQEVEL